MNTRISGHWGFPAHPTRVQASCVEAGRVFREGIQKAHMAREANSRSVRDVQIHRMELLTPEERDLAILNAVNNLRRRVWFTRTARLHALVSRHFDYMPRAHRRWARPSRTPGL